MSTLAARARAEADAAEAEHPDESEEEAEVETPAEPAPAPEPEPQAVAPQMTEQEAEREFGKLEKAAQTYLGKALPLAEKLGIPVQACPLCTFPGLAITREPHEVTSDLEAAINALLGKAAGPEYKASAAYARCETCDGWGDVLTGAQKDVSRTAMCTDCGGKGYTMVVPQFTPTPANGAPQYPGASIAYTPLPTGTNDKWDRPAGHPHWGLDPATIGV